MTTHRGLKKEAREAKAVQIKKVALQPWPKGIPESFWDMCYQYTEKSSSHFMDMMWLARHNKDVLSLSVTQTKDSQILELYIKYRMRKRTYRITTYGAPVFYVEEE